MLQALFTVPGALRGAQPVSPKGNAGNGRGQSQEQRESRVLRDAVLSFGSNARELAQGKGRLPQTNSLEAYGPVPAGRQRPGPPAQSGASLAVLQRAVRSFSAGQSSEGTDVEASRDAQSLGAGRGVPFEVLRRAAAGRLLTPFGSAEPGAGSEVESAGGRVALLGSDDSQEADSRAPSVPYEVLQRAVTSADPGLAFEVPEGATAPFGREIPFDMATPSTEAEAASPVEPTVADAEG